MPFLTTKYHLKIKGKQKRLLDLLCHISKNIYNASLYEIRQQYFKEECICDYYSLNNIMSINENYHILNTYMSICTIRNAHVNMMKFINNKAKLPKYLSKNEYYPLITDQIRIIERNKKKVIKLPISNIIRTNKVFNTKYSDELINRFIEESRLSKNIDIYLKIPKRIEDKRIRQIRIVPKYKAYYYEVEFTYIDDGEIIQTEGKEEMGIDIGLNNLATCATTNNESFIIDGKSLKSRNRLYNKKLSYLQNKNSKKGYTKRMKKLIIHHSNYVKDYINKAVKKLIEKAKSLKVGKIIIGYNKGFKRKGIKNEAITKKEKRVINQNFVQIPLSKFKERIKQVSKKEGIECIEINESYTSLASFYDYDECKYGEIFSGKRVKRGIYLTSEGKEINADVNAALNILNKSNSNNNKMSYLRSRGITIPKRIQVSL